MSQIPLAEWRATGQFFTHRGHRIFCRSGGVADAPALLLIHGFPTASWDWEALWPGLTARYHVLTLDMLGFGFSDKPARHDYSLLSQADLLEDFLRQRGVSEYHVLAHDYGDTVAQELLARQSQTGERAALRSVCLLNGGLFPESHRPLLTQKLLLSPLGPWVARLSTRGTLERSMRRIFGRTTPPTAEQIDAFWALMNHNQGKVVLPSVIRYMHERVLYRERWVGALQRTAIPMRLIDGVVDPISGEHMVERYQALIPRPDVVRLEGIGHYPQVEAPQQVLEGYLTFRDALLATGR